MYTKLSASSTGRFTGAGLRVWDSNNNLVAQKDESVNYSLSGMEIYYNIRNETGVSLKEGTRYKYQMYGVFNGKTYWTSVKTFTTNSTVKSSCDNGHKYTTTVTAATKTANGKKITKCSVCGYVLGTSTIYKANNIKLSYTSTVYNGYKKTPTVTVKNSNGTTLKKGTDYTVYYPTNRKNVGKYTVKVVFKGNYKGTAYLAFSIKPKATSLKSLSSSSKAFTAKWYLQKSQTRGYQISYSTGAKNSTKYKTVSNISSSSVKVSGLKKNTVYYVKIRTYKTVNGTKIYSAWSNTKAVRTRWF